MPTARLLAWYDRQLRDLPWRRNRDPYRVWVSEVMLQQTRAAVVAPYFERFVGRFPDLEALATADLDQVLAAWSGLGYYRRARQLHAAARLLAARGTGVPSTVPELLALPGVGPYTAAAIASIAFGLPVPVVDGNVERVAARLAALDGDPRAARGRRRITEIAARLVDPRRPGDSNQAMMELGATVCTPRRPRCPQCPLMAPIVAPGGGETWPGCRAARFSDPERHPPPRRRRPVERRRQVLALVEDGEARVLLIRRPHGEGMLAGTWELPSVAGEEAGASTDERAAAFARRYGGRWRLGEQIARARHTITFRDLELAVHRGELEGLDPAVAGGEAGWHSRAALGGLPLSSLVTKALAAVAAAEREDAPGPPAATRSGGRRR